MTHDMAGEHVGIVLRDTGPLPSGPLLMRQTHGMSDLHWRLMERSKRLHSIIHPVMNGLPHKEWETCSYEPCKGDRESLRAESEPVT